MDEQAKLEILVTLKDEVSAAFKRAGENISKSGDNISKKIGFLNRDVSALSKTILGTATAAGGLAIAFGASAIKSYSEAQVGLAKIDAILKTMGPAALKNRDALLSNAQAAVKLGFDDDAAAASIARLYQRTGDLTKATELNVFAMDLARFKNISLEQASSAVNMALSGNVRVLKELGVVADENVSPLNAIAQAQKVIAGQAEAFSTTFPGMMATINETWSNMKDEIGKVLVDALGPFIQQFTAWLTNPDTQAKFQQWTASFKSWAEVIIPVLVDTFKMWATAIGVVKNAMLTFGDAILKVYEYLDKLISRWNDFTKSSVTGKAAKAGLNAVKSIVPGGTIIPFATGGIVTGPTLGLLGEAGPEAVIPLNRAGRGGIGATTVNINGGYYLSEDAAERIGDLIIKKLQLSNQL